MGFEFSGELGLAAHGCAGVPQIRDRAFHASIHIVANLDAVRDIARTRA
jgi:hypothetical protein